MSARRALCLALALLAACALAPARAVEPEPLPAVMQKVNAACERGAFSEALDQLELLSDQGIVQADLSFNRGLVYLRRAESPNKQATDLAQAAAAFQEAGELDPSDTQASLLLERVREAISQQHARSGDPLMARPRLLRALLGLIGEDVWAVIAILGSACATLGLALRLWAKGRNVHLSASVLYSVGGALLLLGGGMASGARHLRLSTTPAVIISEQAQLLDEAGRPMSRPSQREGSAIPEGSPVYIHELRGALAKVEWGEQEAWVSLRDLRRLASR
jgi:tetratricopeptide (TPR) repeat protein